MLSEAGGGQEVKPPGEKKKKKRTAVRRRRDKAEAGEGKDTCAGPRFIISIVNPGLSHESVQLNAAISICDVGGGL